MKEAALDVLLITKPANMVIAFGNCGLYTGPWGLRVEDTVLASPEGPKVLTGYPRQLKK
jgi:Xaa-Pro aminopeptidase